MEQEQSGSFLLSVNRVIIVLKIFKEQSTVPVGLVRGT